MFSDRIEGVQKNNNVTKHLLKRVVDLYGQKYRSIFDGHPQMLKEANRFFSNEK